MHRLGFKTNNVLSVLILVIGLTDGLTAPNPYIQNTSSVQEQRYVNLGGVKQWITIRGENRANPVLLIVNGGPGDAQSGLRSIYAVYEKNFTVVQWDQRGAGKTYAINPNSPPEPERVELDGIELAQYLCQYLAKKKILVLV